MKKFLIFAAASVLMLGTASCNKVPAGFSGTANFFVELGSGQTKATTGFSDAFEKNVKNFQVVVFYADEAENGENRGKFETYAGGISNEGVTKLAVSCAKGPKTIYAVVNYPESLDGIASIDALKAKVSTLASQDFNSFTMVGEKSQVVEGGGNSIVIDVYRIAARVVVNKITNAFKVAVNQAKTFKVNALYLTNVQGANTLDKDGFQAAEGTWYNKKGFDNSELSKKFLWDNMNDVVIAYGSSYEGQHVFYAFPNDADNDVWGGDEWSKRATRLVIEAELGGEKMYYPINLQPFQSNKSYEISEVIITKVGSAGPDDPVTSDDIEVSINVKEWDVIPVNSAGQSGGVYQF